MHVNDDPSLDIADQIYVDNDTVSFVFDRYDTWHDVESDVSALVAWLRAHKLDVYGDVEVSGEETDDLWRMHVTEGSVVKQRGYVVYEGDVP
jgi:hypothetical protein